MKQQNEFDKKFLTNTDDTGRMIVISKRTGKKYYIEAVGSGRNADWGSYNPSTGNIENKKGFGKHRGSIHEFDSLITLENGFNKIHTLGVGESPHSFIETLDSEYKSL